MSDIESLKGELKKLSAKAMQAKMDLHDLSEELPAGVETVMAVAQRVRDAYAALDARRAELKALEAAA
ncbi:CCE_0567 family metalloprotein [Novosphingobium album (ex Liu et al. 2023)]|uniref:CCE_0567 family metalloprotein n=1 Tax=Novosphingobium album (ex Liu et al. 2023) TaxID=3031130 RepID=A0ABT5WS73_9SPHN|nr:CCE_0567 family metalloprotein [Novosphingobium album (ex Liu et al. 2023)]MDE8652878.1 CCE_0567 family metalloprotein [Novosphingobium album (ex Liu et al. 2023)]